MKNRRDPKRRGGPLESLAAYGLLLALGGALAWGFVTGELPRRETPPPAAAAVSGASAPESRSDASDAPEAAEEKAPLAREVRAAIRNLTRTGALKLEDPQPLTGPSIARVNPVAWSALELERKQNLTRLCHQYFQRERGRGDVEIRSTRNDTVLAEMRGWAVRPTIRR